VTYIFSNLRQIPPSLVPGTETGGFEIPVTQTSKAAGPVLFVFSLFIKGTFFVAKN
jgi:hypothetical protein